jgi:hypothetical protein
MLHKEPDSSYKIPRIIYADAYASEMVAYADLVLPDTLGLHLAARSPHRLRRGTGALALLRRGAPHGDALLRRISGLGPVRPGLRKAPAYGTFPRHKSAPP